MGMGMGGTGMGIGGKTGKVSPAKILAYKKMNEQYRAAMSDRLLVRLVVSGLITVYREPEAETKRLLDLYTGKGAQPGSDSAENAAMNETDAATGEEGEPGDGEPGDGEAAPATDEQSDSADNTAGQSSDGSDQTTDESGQPGDGTNATDSGATDNSNTPPDGNDPDAAGEKASTDNTTTPAEGSGTGS